MVNRPARRNTFYAEKGNRKGWRDLLPVWEATETYLTLSERLSSMKRGSPLFPATNDHALRLPVVRRALGLDAINDTGELALSTQVLEQEATQEPLDETSLNKIVTRAALRAGLGEWNETAWQWGHVPHHISAPDTQAGHGSPNRLDDANELMAQDHLPLVLTH